MTKRHEEATSSARGPRRLAYSSAAERSWIEQGPTTIANRGSCPVKRRRQLCRHCSMNAFCLAVIGSLFLIWQGESISLFKMSNLAFTLKRKVFKSPLGLILAMGDD